MLRAACPSVQGQLVGGVIEPEQPGTQRFRLWMYDFGTGQAAYLDEWCKRGCNLGEEMGRQTFALLDNPRVRAVSTQPGYCVPIPEPPAPKPRSARVTVAIAGDSRIRSTTWNAVKNRLTSLGREPVLLPSEGYVNAPALRKLAKADPNGQVLGLELTAEGADLWVFDAIKNEQYPAKFKCRDCTKEDLADKLAFRAGALLDEAIQPDPIRTPPDDACTPFAFAQCGGAANISSAGIDPKLATTLKGLAWGAFAVTTAASLGLFAANATEAGVQRGRYDEAQNSLVRPAWAMAGASALMLGIAIPVHILISRASSNPSGSPGTAARAPLQCPN